MPATAGVLIQFPFYGAIAAIMTQAPRTARGSRSRIRSRTPSSRMSTQHLFPLVIGVYSAVLGFFIPSGGGKWLLEAPYVMQAANDLQVHLGWAVQIYNAAEALPNLINPFWMLPLLGVLGLKARDIVGFTFLQLLRAPAAGAVPAVGAGLHAALPPAGHAVTDGTNGPARIAHDPFGGRR